MSLFNTKHNNSTAQSVVAKTETEFETFSRYRNDIKNMTEDLKRYFRDVFLEETEVNIRASNVNEISVKEYYANVTALWETVCRDRSENLKAEAKDFQTVYNQH